MKFHQDLFLKQAKGRRFCRGKGSICGCFFLCFCFGRLFVFKIRSVLQKLHLCSPHSFYKTCRGIKYADEIGCFSQPKRDGKPSLFLILFDFIYNTLTVKKKCHLLSFFIIEFFYIIYTASTCQA